MCCANRPTRSVLTRINLLHIWSKAFPNHPANLFCHFYTSVVMVWAIWWFAIESFGATCASSIIRNNCFCSLPGRNEAFWKELDHVKELWKNKKDLHVEQVGIAALFGLECFAWYCAGEIVGRGFTFTGYYVWVCNS